MATQRHHIPNMLYILQQVLETGKLLNQGLSPKQIHISGQGKDYSVNIIGKFMNTPGKICKGSPYTVYQYKSYYW